MITPTYSPTATERILPRLALDFTTAVTDARVTTTRDTNSATRFNSSGVLEIVNANLPRYDYDPVTKVCRGQLSEGQRTNLFLNSLLNGTNLATQSVTLTAAAYTVSFYGSGSITISGGHSANVTGIGDFPSRQAYTFTPTAGSSTFTVSGDVKFANLEAGAFASSFIPTAATSVIRFNDAINIGGTNFTSFYNENEGTLAANIALMNNVIGGNPAAIKNTASTNTIGFELDASNNIRWRVTNAGVNQVILFIGSNAAPNTQYRLCGSYKTARAIGSVNANTPAVGGLGTVPTSNTYLTIGSGTSAGNSSLFGHVEKIFYWPQAMAAAEVQAFAK